MALSENDKQNIIEEETLRQETRSKLAEQGSCGCKCHSHGQSHCGCGKWGWIAAAILAVLLILSHCHRCCCPMGGWGHCGMGPGRGMAPNCQMMAGQPGQPQPGQPAPEAKAKK
jgi:hypothetical protein